MKIVLLFSCMIFVSVDGNCAVTCVTDSNNTVHCRAYKDVITDATSVAADYINTAKPTILGACPKSGWYAMVETVEVVSDEKLGNVYGKSHGLGVACGFPTPESALNRAISECQKRGDCRKITKFGVFYDSGNYDSSGYPIIPPDLIQSQVRCRREWQGKYKDQLLTWNSPNEGDMFDFGRSLCEKTLNKVNQ